MFSRQKNDRNKASRILSFARRYKRPLTVAYVDLDNFKSVNDTMGHKAGDEVLRTVADVLRKSIRKSDIDPVSFLAAPSDVEILVQEADGRMYAAKAAGRNRIEMIVVDRSSEVPVAST